MFQFLTSFFASQTNKKRPPVLSLGFAYDTLAMERNHVAVTRYFAFLFLFLVLVDLLLLLSRCFAFLLRFFAALLFSAKF